VRRGYKAPLLDGARQLAQERKKKREKSSSTPGTQLQSLRHALEMIDLAPNPMKIAMMGR
jgi:hypothetical protein